MDVLLFLKRLCVSDAFSKLYPLWLDWFTVFAAWIVDKHKASFVFVSKFLRNLLISSKLLDSGAIEEVGLQFKSQHLWSHFLRLFGVILSQRRLRSWSRNRQRLQPNLIYSYHHISFPNAKTALIPDFAPNVGRAGLPCAAENLVRLLRVPITPTANIPENLHSPGTKMVKIPAQRF